MSTRAIIVVTGSHRLYAWESIVRLYRHHDGYPTEVLADVVRATETAVSFIHNHSSLLTVFRKDGLCPTLDEMPAEGFAAQIIAAGNCWDGSSFRFDDPDEQGLPPITHGPLEVRHFGNHGDLEWIYLVNVKRRGLTIFGGEFGAVEVHFARGAVDPLSYADRLRADCQEDERMRIRVAMDQLMDQGWDITPAGKRKRKRNRKPVTS
jgi:hypothetical protein